MKALLYAMILIGLVASAESHAAAPSAAGGAVNFPVPLDQYPATETTSLLDVLKHRAAYEPFNLIATGIFLLAIVHTFLASKIMHIAHQWRDEHAARIEAEGRTGEAKPQPDAKGDVSFKAEIMHFFGEVEAIFGIWVLPLLMALIVFKGWGTAESYVSHGVSFTEPMFVVPSFTPELKYAVVAGAVAGGGLTVIANAPNPAGQSILSAYFPEGVSPLYLLLAALPPTLLAALCFLLLR